MVKPSEEGRSKRRQATSWVLTNSQVAKAKEKFLKEMKSAIQWTYEWQENEIDLQLIFRRKYEWPEWKIKQATILP